jgi:hypothetical protein
MIFSQSSAWLALFYMFIPVGRALGYVFGGVVWTFLQMYLTFVSAKVKKVLP